MPTVESIVKSIAKWWKNAPAIIVIDTTLDAPKEVSDKYQRETKAATKAGERLGEVNGFHHAGRPRVHRGRCRDRRTVCGGHGIPRSARLITGCAAPSASASSRSWIPSIDMRPADVANKAIGIRHGVAAYWRQRRKLTANAILRGMTRMTAAPPLKKC